MKHNQNKINGFSLIEMAIVLAIIGILMAGILPTITGQIDQQRRTETRKYLNEAQEALYGYSLINRRLPCPDTNNDGIAESSCMTTASQFGTIPYNDLGINNKDAFNSALIYAVTQTFANSGVPFTLSTTGAMRICTTAACTTTLTTNAVSVIASRGANWAQPPSADETENTNNDVNFVSHDVQTDFDDLVLWISPNTLSSRMVAAGKLP